MQSNTVTVNGYTFRLYGYRNHRCLYVTGSNGYRTRTMSTNIVDSFSVNDIRNVEENYDRCGGDFKCIEVTYLTCSSGREEDLYSRKERFSQLAATFPIESADSYDLIDKLIELGEHLGLPTPKFAERDEDWCGYSWGIHTDKPYKFPYDEIVEWMDAIGKVAKDAIERLDGLKGKDIYAIINDLTESKNREKGLNEQIEARDKEIAELKEENTRQENALRKAAELYSQLYKEKSQLVAERAEFGSKVLTAVTSALITLQPNIDVS
jgi:hypothetical protein